MMGFRDEEEGGGKGKATEVIVTSAARNEIQAKDLKKAKC